MTDATLHLSDRPATEPARPLPPKPDWPLIGDIVTARLDRPELLRLWQARPHAR